MKKAFAAAAVMTLGFAIVPSGQADATIVSGNFTGGIRAEIPGGSLSTWQAENGIYGGEPVALNLTYDTDKFSYATNYGPTGSEWHSTAADSATLTIHVGTSTYVASSAYLVFVDPTFVNIYFGVLTGLDCLTPSSCGAHFFLTGFVLSDAGALPTTMPTFAPVWTSAIGYFGGSNASEGFQVVVDPTIANAVPEAATWVMSVLGFMGLGLFGSRRRNQNLCKQAFRFCLTSFYTPRRIIGESAGRFSSLTPFH